MLITVKCDKGDSHYFRGARYFKLEANSLLILDHDDAVIAAFAQGKWHNVVSVKEGEN